MPRVYAEEDGWGWAAARSWCSAGDAPAAVVRSPAQNDRIDAELIAPGTRSARTLRSL